MTSSSAEEYTKVLRRRMISEVLQKPHNEVWKIQQQNKKQSQQQPQTQRVSRPNEAKRPSSKVDQRRSQSASGKRSNAVSTETKSIQNRPGLGRRSATQLEISRRKKVDEDVTPLRQSKWHSQEHLDQVKFMNHDISRNFHSLKKHI